MTNEWVIRPARPADASTIAEFNTLLASETEATTLDPETVLAGVTALLQNPGYGRYRVAEQDGQIIGQLLHTFEWSDWRNGMIWWFQSVYVHKDHRRRGVFRSLADDLITEAERSADVVGLRLYVEHENEAAKQTYQALHFEGGEYEVMQRVPLRVDNQS